MENKNVAIWVLAFALFGAILEVPGLFLGRVLADAVLFGGGAFVVCCIISWRRNRNRQTSTF